MNYKFEKTEKSTVKITITLDQAEWLAAQDKAFQKTKGKYSLQGFRKGHVPKAVIERVYGSGVFYEDAINEAFPEYYYDILGKEPTIEAIDRPEIDVGKLDESGIELIAIVPVKPEVKIARYKGIKIEKVEYNVEDGAVQAEVDKLLERNSRLVEVTDRKAENGDTVIIDYSGSVDGVKFDGGTAEKQTLVLGSGSFIPGFEEQVVGMAIGEEKDIEVKFPDDYHEESLKGKNSVFKVVIHEIKHKELPELNDEFIKDAVGVESVEAYKKEQKERLEAEAKKKSEAEVEDKLIKAIAEETEVEIPEVLVEKQIDSMIKDFEYRLMYQFRGMKLEDYLKYVNITMEQLRAEYKKQAEKDVKSQLIVDKLINEEKIEATDDELNAKLTEMANEAKKSFDEYTKDMNPRNKDYVKDGIIISKLFDFLKANNELTVISEKQAKAKAEKEAKAAAEKATKTSEEKTAKTEKASKTKTEKTK